MTTYFFLNLFYLHMKPLSTSIDSYSLAHHLLADDLYLEMSTAPDDLSKVIHFS